MNSFLDKTGLSYLWTKIKNIVNDVDTKAEAISSTMSTHINNKSNPHNVTAAQIGLGNVNNTADSVKSVASAAKLTTPRSIGLSGVVTATASSFDGTSDILINVTSLSPSGMSSGTLPTGVRATNSTDYTTSRIRNIKASTVDLTAGSSYLANGEIYLVYE